MHRALHFKSALTFSMFYQDRNLLLNLTNCFELPEHNHENLSIWTFRIGGKQFADVLNINVSIRSQGCLKVQCVYLRVLYLQIMADVFVFI